MSSDSNDEQDVIIVQNSPTPVTTPVHDVPNHEEVAQSVLSPSLDLNDDDIEKFSSLQTQEQEGKDSSSVSPASTPTAFAGNTPPVSPRPSAGRLFLLQETPILLIDILANCLPMQSSSSYDDEYHGPDISNQEKEILVNPITTKKVNEAHPYSLIIGDLHTPVQTRKKAKAQILKNKRDARGIVCSYKARLVAQGHRQEEGIDYTEMFAPVARVKVIRLFLAFASYMGFMMYQMDVKSAFLNGEIQEEVYVTQPKGFEDPKYPKRVYKVVKISVWSSSGS
uniref:Copia protein n=1 Tax=Tanacetum cinerariifolium TaxID=118510 RepID=A0A699KVG0_TANCI|nr:copia protein [Tanacetum cinerariifolium]